MSRFTSVEDAVDRLLPYHVWQVPDSELDKLDESPESGGFHASSLLTQQV